MSNWKFSAHKFGFGDLISVASSTSFTAKYVLIKVQNNSRINELKGFFSIHLRVKKTRFSPWKRGIFLGKQLDIDFDITAFQDI